jgi:hypothetical protein
VLASMGGWDKQLGPAGLVSQRHKVLWDGLVSFSYIILKASIRNRPSHNGHRQHCQQRSNANYAQGLSMS